MAKTTTVKRMPGLEYTKAFLDDLVARILKQSSEWSPPPTTWRESMPIPTPRNQRKVRKVARQTYRAVK